MSDSETQSDFTAQEVFDSVNGGVDTYRFFNEEDENYVVPTVVYADKDGKEVEYSFQAATDERGFKKVARVENKVYEDEYEVEALLEDNDFMYEGGFVPGFGAFRMVDNGNLGDGHEAWALVEHESGRLFRIGGWYSSWDSGEWNECVEVVPAEVTVVRYRDIDNEKRVFDNPAVTV